jgi:MFS family permease
MHFTLLQKQKTLLKHKNIKKYYLLTFFNSLVFGESSWIFFWSLFLSYSQIGLIDAVGFGLGLLLEIPTGALGDLIGKKRTILLALLFTTLGVGVMTGAVGFSSMLFGFMGFQVGFALYSGTSEALAYDSLVEENAEDDFEEVVSFMNVIMIVTTVLASFVGGYFLYKIDPRAPYLFWGISQALAFITALTLVEPIIDGEKFSLKSYLSQIKIGAQKLFGKTLRKYVLSIFIISGFFFIFDWGFLKPAMAVNLGFSSNVLAIVSPVLYLASALAITQLHRFRAFFGDNAGLMFLSVLIGSGMLLGSFSIGIFGVVPLLFISVAGNLGAPWLSIIINNRVESKYRATVLSTVAFLTKLPYVVFSVLIGESMQKGDLSQFTAIVAVVVFAVVLLSFFGGAYSLEKQKVRTNI